MPTGTKEAVLEHEILKCLFETIGYSLTAVGTHETGYTPIYKREYSNSSMHFGTLVDILNNPEKYEVKPSGDLFYLKNKKTKVEEVQILNYEWFAVTDALELMKNNRHISDISSVTPFDQISERVIGLTYEGAIAYIDKYYIKEYRKSQLSTIDR